MKILHKLNGQRILESVKRGFQLYKDEKGNSFEGVTVHNVLIVGSGIREDFEPYDSDIDICIILQGSDTDGPIAGPDIFFRESYQPSLKTAIGVPVSHVDVGVYSYSSYAEHIDDNTAYSCGEDRLVDI